MGCDPTKSTFDLCRAIASQRCPRDGRATQASWSCFVSSTTVDSRLPRGAQFHVSAMNSTEAYAFGDPVAWNHSSGMGTMPAREVAS